MFERFNEYMPQLGVFENELWGGGGGAGAIMGRREGAVNFSAYLCPCLAFQWPDNVKMYQ